MQSFRGDLHIHSVLSPCADLDMSPENIVVRAKKQKLDFIAVTDHNSTRNFEAVQKAAFCENIFVLPGCEVNTLPKKFMCLFFFQI